MKQNASKPPDPFRSGRRNGAPARLGLIAAYLGFLAAVGWAQESSPSNASNFGGSSDLSVDARTGAVSIDAELFRITGVREEVSTRLTLSFSSEHAVSEFDESSTVFGLPYGWSLDLSHFVNKSTYEEVRLDGTQTYVLDTDWRTQFTPAGQTQSVIVRTGLKQYSKADTHFRPDSGSVVVDGIPSAFVLATLGGRTQYLSGSGLLLQDTDMFGNATQYFYNGNLSPDRARLMRIVDTWGNEISLDYSLPGRVTVTLPDGRTVGWLYGDQITGIFDGEGKVTHFTWGRQCGLYEMPTGVTSPGGTFTTVEYQCMNVCTQRTFPSECSGSVRQWPVALVRYDCPSNPSGARCPSGSSQDFTTTTYQIGGTPGSVQSNNYTGYPLYSPYAAEDPAADALMESNNSSFFYTTAVERGDTGGIVHYRTEGEYNFLHLEIESRNFVRDSGFGSLVLAKETSTCYAPSPTASCPRNFAFDYAQLPANYQQATRSGSCVYAVTGEPILDHAYDSFGNMLQRKVHHGTSTTGVVSTCDRSTRLDPSRLQVVLDIYFQYDTPASVANGFLELGAGSGHFGLLSAFKSFVYGDPDDAEELAAQAVAAAARGESR
jgi:hypothetical protein